MRIVPLTWEKTPMLLPADIAAPPVAFVLGVAVVFLLVPIIVVETIVLRVLRWGGLGISFLAALAMNVASSAVGVLLLNLPERAFVLDATAATFLSLLIAWALSTLMEGGIMQAFGRSALRRTFGIAAVANVASYTLLVVFVLFVARDF